MKKTIQPRLIIHGGAGTLEGNIPDLATKNPKELQRLESIHHSLQKIAKESYQILCEQSSQAAVLAAVKMLEDDPLFNAGTGAKLQLDGKARLSAGLMDGTHNRFSGVINIEQVQHPIEIAQRLSNHPHSVLVGAQATSFARQEGYPAHDPITPERLEEHRKRVQGASGTVGAVALDATGRIVAGTSTGGIGGETPGRASDCPTVAGTYASIHAGVSCTGIGEEIINTAAAARIVTRVDDGAPLEDAVRKTMGEANSHGYRFGLIALDDHGAVRVGSTNGVSVLFAINDGEESRTFFDHL